MQALEGGAIEGANKVTMYQPDTVKSADDGKSAEKM